MAAAVLLFVGGAVVTWYRSAFDENQATILPSANPVSPAPARNTNRPFPQRSAPARTASAPETDPEVAAALAKVQEALNDPRPTTRYPNPVMQEALAALGSQGQAAVPLLHSALRNALREPAKYENMQVIRRAADALGLIGPEAREAVPDLVELLRANLSEMESLARVNALARIGPELPEIVPDLVQILKEKRKTRLWIANALPSISGGDVKRVGQLVSPLLRDADIRVRVAAADVLWTMLKGQSGPDVTKVAIEFLNSSGEDYSLFISRMLGILQSAAQDPKHPGRVLPANLGAAAPEAIAALIHVANTSKHESVKAQALELLDGLTPGLRQENSGMDALLRRREELNAFVEKIRDGQASAPELIEGLKQFPGMAHSATEALVRLGPQAQAALPALREALAVLEPKPGNTQVPGAGYPAREAVANAIQRIAPDQPKPLFTSADVSLVIGIWLGPDSRWLDKDRYARISGALRPTMAYLMEHGHQMPPEQMQAVLETLKKVDPVGL